MYKLDILILIILLTVLFIVIIYMLVIKLKDWYKKYQLDRKIRKVDAVQLKIKWKKD